MPISSALAMAALICSESVTSTLTKTPSISLAISSPFGVHIGDDDLDALWRPGRVPRRHQCPTHRR